MKKVFISIFVALTFLSSSCESSNGSSTSDTEVNEEKGYVLNCDIQNAPDGKVFLEKINGQNFVTKETIEIKAQTQFSFKGNLEEPEFYRVRFFNGKFFFVVLENKEISVKGDANDLFNTLQVEGSEATQKFNDFVVENSKRTSAVQQMQMEFQQRAMAGDANAQTEFQQKYAEMADENSKFMKGIIDENISSIIAPYLALSLDIETEYQYMKEVSAKISENQSNAYERNLATMIGNYKNLAVGEPAPEIALPSPEGEVVKLSDYRGKVVLIDFWASWCRPCRAENPNVVRMYKQFKDKNFEIFGVSLDKSKDAWVKAIENDGITWPQVSDLKFWGSEAAQTYQVKGIPQTFLIDAEGNILAKNLRGPALEAKLKEVLGE